MKKAKFIISLILAAVTVCAQVLTVFAAPASAHPITGEVTYVEVDTNDDTGVTTVLVTVADEMGVSQTVRISAETAARLNLIYNDGEQYVIVEPLPDSIEIKPNAVIPDEPQHPIVSALATFFDVDYVSIMTAYESGNSFGAIAQALWLAKEVAGEDTTLTEVVFVDIMVARDDGDYGDFYALYFPDEETIPANWGQFRKELKSLLDVGKKANLGAVMSQHDETANANSQTNHGKDNKKDKPEHPNNGNGPNRPNNGNGPNH